MATKSTTKQKIKDHEVSVKPSEYVELLDASIKTHKPLCVWGDPGIGKTVITQDYAKNNGMDLIVIQAVTLDPVDLRGLPSVHTREDNVRLCVWARPNFLPDQDKEKPTLIFVDELNRAAMLTQNAVMRLVNERELGEYRLPDNAYVIAACNDTKNSKGVIATSEAMNNRFTHIFLEPDLDDWTHWALEADIHPMVVAFLRHSPQHFSDFQRDHKAYASPRSWEAVSNYAKLGLRDQIALPLYSGTIGTAAVEYLAYEKLFKNLPSLEEIILRPATAPIPKEPSALIGIATALARKVDEKNIERIAQYLERKEFGIEYSTYCWVDMLRKDKSLSKTPTYTKMLLKNKSIFGAVQNYTFLLRQHETPVSGGSYYFEEDYEC